MNRPTFLRRSTALLLTLVLMVCAALPGFAAYQMPIQTASDTESVYLFNLDTGKPILRQNSDQQRYIASLTKMMTALLFLESGKDMNAEITIPTSLTQEFKDIQNANGSTMNLRIGETVRRIDLLYGLLVASANDAANVLAEYTAGSMEAFVELMNAKAAELGLAGTHFVNANGLHIPRSCLFFPTVAVYQRYSRSVGDTSAIAYRPRRASLSRLRFYNQLARQDFRVRHSRPWQHSNRILFPHKQPATAYQYRLAAHVVFYLLLFGNGQPDSHF